MARSMNGLSAENAMYLHSHKLLEDGCPEFYIKETQDLTHAILMALRDLGAIEKKLDLLLPKLRLLRKRLEAATKLAGPTVQPVVLADLLEVASDLETETKALDKVVSLRRDKKEGK